MFNSNWASLKPEISMYEVIRHAKKDNEFNLEGLISPKGNNREDQSSSEDGNMLVLSKDSFKDASANFRQFMDKVRRLDVALIASAEKNDVYYSNLHIKYRRTLSTQDIESMFAVLLASHKLSNKSKRNWTEEEILLLIYFVRFFCLGHELTPITMTEDDWWVIAKLLPRRAADVTKDKWMSLHHIHIHDAPWTTEEDGQLMHLIQRYGLKKWTAIARELNKCAKNSLIFRQGKQCRERWINHLDPSINKGAWTAEEDIKLLKAVTDLGKKWSEIAKMISNRTENAVKNRWKSLIKKHKFEFSSMSGGNNTNSAAFERVMTQLVLQMRIKESHQNMQSEMHPTLGLSTQGTSQPVTEEQSPQEDDQIDWLLDNIDEGIQVKQIPESCSKKSEQIPSMKVIDHRLAESSNIKLLNSLFTAGNTNFVNANEATPRAGIEHNHFFPELRLDRGRCSTVKTEHDTTDALTPAKPNVAFKSINELDDMKELENLEICLFNGNRKVVYKASDPAQKKVLHNFILSLISLEDAKRDTFESLLNNATGFVEAPHQKVMSPEMKQETPKLMTSATTFQQLINSNRSSNMEGGKPANTNGMLNLDSNKNSGAGSDAFNGRGRNDCFHFQNFEEEFYDKPKGNMLNSSLSGFLDAEESPFFRNIKDTVTPFFK